MEMLRPESNEIPELTRFVAEAALPDGNLFMRMRDELGPIFEDEEFADLYPSIGQPAESPARLALVTVMQFVEDIGDRQAAEAVRERISWKYVLGLELTDPGFHYSVLTEFRQRLIAGGAERLLLDKLLERCTVRGLLKGKTKQRTDSTHVLAAIRTLTLLELAGETMRKTLDAVARVAPDWLQERMQPEWIKRYGRRFDGYRLPKGKKRRLELAIAIGQDGYYLLNAALHETAPAEVRTLPAIDIMRRIWVQQFYWCEGDVHWRTKKKWGQPPAGKMLSSMEDLEARYRVKRSTEWTGYLVHLTETCQKEQPRLITQVETTVASVHDSKVTATIHDDLADRELLPETHLVDEGYMEADLLVGSQKRGIDLVGPVPSSKSWQSREEGAFDHTQFELDWEQRVAICPGGKRSRSWSDRKSWRGTPNIMVSFRPEDCVPCPLRARCTRSRSGGRTLTIYPQEQYEAQQKARERQETEAFKKLYGERAGIEGTVSQGVRSMGLRQSRYIGLAGTHLQHVATAAAINVVRVGNWLAGEEPEPTRVSPFQALTPI
jgi:transposase